MKNTIFICIKLCLYWFFERAAFFCFCLWYELWNGSIVKIASVVTCKVARVCTIHSFCYMKFKTRNVSQLTNNWQLCICSQILYRSSYVMCFLLSGNNSYLPSPSHAHPHAYAHSLTHISRWPREERQTEKSWLKHISPFHKSSCSVVNMMNERIKRERHTERRETEFLDEGGGGTVWPEDMTPAVEHFYCNILQWSNVIANVDIFTTVMESKLEHFIQCLDGQQICRCVCACMHEGVAYQISGPNCCYLPLAS